MINNSSPIVSDLREKKVHAVASTGASVGRLRQPAARQGSLSSTNKDPLIAPVRETDGYSPLASVPPGAVDLGGGANVLPKQRGEVTVVRAPDLRSDVDEWYVGLDQQPLRLLHPARNHVLVGRLPGGALEQARKVAPARLRHSGKPRQGELLVPLGPAIPERAPH